MAGQLSSSKNGAVAELWPGQEVPAIDPLRPDQRHRQFGRLLEFSPDAIVIVDADGLVMEWNPAAEPMLTTTSAQAVRAPLRKLLSSPNRESFDTAWQQLLAGEKVPSVKAPPGTNAHFAPRLDVTVVPFRFGAALAGAVVILPDPAARTMVTDNITVQAEGPPGTDPLSAPGALEHDGPGGLPGRWWLQRILSDPPGPGMARSVAIFDVDAFGVMVATYGPHAADAILAVLGERLKSLDTPGTFAHWRASSFVWILDTDNPVAALDQWVTSLTDALGEPFVVGPDRVFLTVSMGLAATTLAKDGDLLAAATDALQSAKRSGGSRAVYYDASMAARASSGFRLANDLHHAIMHDELRLHYQPIMDLSTNEIAGVEALVRWERPGVGLLAPDSFIDAAERTGQIVPLGNWVVRTACMDAARLGTHSRGSRTMSINISARQLADPGLIATLRQAMTAGKCAPSTIIIEVTESVLVDDLNTIAESLEAIKALDVGVDLDDFGTGYSSLQYLRNLPIDRLKVERGFVAGLGVNAADTAIVASTIALAHALGLQAIAEGVETDEQLALLREMGCDFAQGFLLSRPADMERCATWLDAYVPAAVVPTGGSRTAALSRKRSKAANRRDRQAETRETTANVRDKIASTRDTDAATRDGAANTRDTAADERERVADLRDVAATDREHAEDQREGRQGGFGSHEVGGDAKSTRRTAKQARSRATAERQVEANDRTVAGTDRDRASAERATAADARTQSRANPPSADDDEA
ncbi:EAL domain-containing protein [Demequina sp.]|uniref:EAL domain-containing protein n=1 Tax=Demequina sp. TaxID=2050685 RepID=UPI0025C72AE6|nr:EAL domain-containing protein [Demequina sp.]